MEDIKINFSCNFGVYVSSYELAKATGKKHQNLMTTVKRKYKRYIHYTTQENKYYKNQVVYMLTKPIITQINKNGIYNQLLQEMEKVQAEKERIIKKQVEEFFNKFMPTL